VQPRKVVFVIDDDNDIREAIRDLLATEGYGTAEARDGSSGLAYLRSHPLPGVILLDWNMAPMNGAAFVSELSRDEALSGIPVVVLTADVRAEKAARAQGLSSLVLKPIDADELLEIARCHCNVGD
jgi:CheY-like chemotaxis protein